MFSNLNLKTSVRIAGAVLGGIVLGIVGFIAADRFEGSLFARELARNAFVNTLDPLRTETGEEFFYQPLSTRRPRIPQTGRAVHADLASMTLALYENGLKITEVPIISKGKPGSFWETPTGEYRALTKEENHFSSIGQVWMPYSISFFGNFFVHGWPTYPSGDPVPEGFSGGCIRLKTEDAKTVYEFVSHQTPIIVTEDAPSTVGERGYIALRNTRPPALSADAYLVADIDSNYVFLEKNRSEQRPIASITKLMTAIISLEAINQEREIAIDKNDLDIHGDSGSLGEGETFTAKQLLAPLLLSSSNDAAYALANITGRGRFVELMNKKAEALQLESTRFSDPSGLEMTNVSTPEELAYLIKYIRNERAPLLTLSRQRTAKLETNQKEHIWYNFNWHSVDEEFLGGKIGYTSAAGKTMVALFRLPVSEFATRDIVVVVLGSNDQESDVRKLVAWVKANFVYGSLSDEKPATAAPVVSDLQRDEPIKLLFTGDIMMDRGIRNTVDRNRGDYLFPFEHVVEKLRGADLTFGNLEGPISDVGKKQGSIYSFRMDPAVTKALYDVGFDAVSLANNHMGDYGREAFEDTMRRLRRAGIEYTGAGWNAKEASEVTVLERGGARLGFLGFSDVGPKWIEVGDTLSGIAIADAEDVKAAVRQARDKVDILIVSFHFGEEYETRSRRNQQELARAAIDAGASIVIGHHPHVAQEIEQYRNGVIAYSLGNFIFDQAFSPDTKEALMFEVTIKNKRIDDFEAIPIHFNTDFQPIITQ
ncbi:MAG: CapA family protein [Patescibacteria group bacterium]